MGITYRLETWKETRRTGRLASLVLMGWLALFAATAAAQTTTPDNQTAARQESSSSSLLMPQGHLKNAIVGSWQITVNEGTANEIRALGIFSSDGTYVGDQQGNISTYPVPDLGGSSVIQSDQYGAWDHYRANIFRLTHVTMFYKALNGELLGSAKVWATFRINSAGDELTGAFVGKTFDKDGNQVFDTQSGTLKAKRIQVEPMP